MAKYFITGISGFIGLELCKLLLKKGHIVVGLVHNNCPPELHELTPDLITADLLEVAAYKSALEDCDYIVHLAGNPKYGNGPEYETQNVATTRALLEAAGSSARKLKRFIFISTIGAVDRSYKDRCDEPLNENSMPYPSSDYGKSKLKSEQDVINSGLPYTIIRPTLVIGDKMRFGSHVAVFSRAAISRSLFARINWPGKISIIHVSDLAHCIIFASQQEATLDNIYFAAGEDVAIGDILKRANMNNYQINLKWLFNLILLLNRFLPFSIKALLLPALTASDSKIRMLGWQCLYTKEQALDEVARRESTRFNAGSSPAGWSLITGAASGLGRELAIQLQATGRNLVLIDKDAEKLQEVLEEEPSIIKLVCDLADWDSAALLLNDTLKKEIANNIIECFLCAGFGLRGEIGKLSSLAQANIVRVNLLSRLQFAARFLPSMVNRQFGRIVFVSSSSAYQALPYMGVYAASNAAILSLGEALGYETKNNGIEVLTVCPGGMSTSFQKSAGVKELEGEKLMEPSEVAGLIIKSLGKNKQVIMPGTRSLAMSIAARLLPRKLSVRLWGKLMSVAR